MKRRTTITLTIAGLLTMAGIFYAANPVPFANLSGPIGVAVSPSLMLVSPYCSDEIDMVDCHATVSFFAAIPGFGSCREKYMAVAPFQSANAVPPFIPRDVFVTQGNSVFKISGGVVTPFATLTGCDPGGDHNGITFDHVGTFGFNLIVTCQSGGVFVLDGNGNGGATPIANTGSEQEGPAVAPSPGFGTFGGQILVADEIDGAVHAIDYRAGHAVTQKAFGIPDAEGVFVIPDAPCTFCGPTFDPGAFFQAIFSYNYVFSYPPTDFTGLGGDILVSAEVGAGIVRIHWNGSTYDTFLFDNSTGGQLEGSSFVDCDVPTPTPTASATFTPTPTATFTPTPTATFTPTPTATFTPTATATFTPTATATFTPTATSTFTPTATSTATATATSTATSTPTPTPTPTFTPCSALASCTPTYPFPSGSPRTNVAFNESTVMKAFRVTTSPDGCTPTTVQVFYSDEHALTLGIRQVQVKQACSGTTGTFTTDYPIAAFTPFPGPTAASVTSPAVGSQIQVPPPNDQAGTDTSDRPMFPALFITDETYNPPNPLAGDWQYGGTGIPPSFVSGTWKAAIRIVDHTTNTVTVTPDADPAANHFNLGPGADPVPPGLVDEGYGAEVRWNIADLGLQPGHTYRLYFMIHDGDQNKTGGDSGQGCAIITMPGGPPASPTPTPTASPTPTPTPTPTATPATLVAAGKLFSGKTVVITFQNNTTASQVLTGLSMSWPQVPNGNLTKITMGGTTIFSTSTHTPLNTSSFLAGTTAARTIGPGLCAVLTFTFQNNVDTHDDAAHYNGTATFTAPGPTTTTVTYLP